MPIVRQWENTVRAIVEKSCKRAA